MKTTRQAEFLKMYPNASKSRGILEICPRDIEKNRSCPYYTPCLGCRKEFWLSEIEIPDKEERLLQEMQQPQEQEAKLDDGKMRISLVPLQIISDIAEVREYGIAKYKDPDNWRRVDVERYANALFRHFAAFLRDPRSEDAESGIAHYKHMACNMAFICELMAGRMRMDNVNRCAACGEVIPEGLQICKSCAAKN